MAEVQSSYHPSLEQFQSLFVGPNSHESQKIKVTEEDANVNVWSPTQIILSLTTLMLVDRGSLNLNEKLSKYWPEHVAEGGKDVQVREFLSDNSNDSGRDKLVTIEDISELVRRTDGRSIEQFIAEEIASPLKTDLHRWIAAERQRQQTSTTNDSEVHVPSEIVTNNAIHAPNSTSQQTDLTKLYPDTIPAHRFHPYARDFSVLDQGPIGKALVTHRRWQQGDFMSRFDGLTVPEVMLHTLQKTDRIHLWDPHFIGNLAHSCNPNVMLDMAEHEMWAVQDIEPGTVLSMDYASTEDHLYRTFQCECTAPGCRGEVTGRKQRRSVKASTNANMSQKSI